MKDKRIKNLLKGGLFAFFMAVGSINLTALEREGIVTRKTYSGNTLEIFINTDTNTLGADHTILIPNLGHPVFIAIDEFTNEGSVIRFEDDHGIAYGRYRRNPALSIISIDGENVLEIIGRDARGNYYSSTFPYADKARQAAQN